jgi:hypothetical protein
MFSFTELREPALSLMSRLNEPSSVTTSRAVDGGAALVVVNTDSQYWTDLVAFLRKVRAFFAQHENPVEEREFSVDSYMSTKKHFLAARLLKEKPTAKIPMKDGKILPEHKADKGLASFPLFGLLHSHVSFFFSFLFTLFR